MKSRIIPFFSKRAQRRLIRDAARREVDGAGFRERMDEWLDTFQIKIIWHKPVDIYEQDAMRLWCLTKPCAKPRTATFFQ